MFAHPPPPLPLPPKRQVTLGQTLLRVTLPASSWYVRLACLSIHITVSVHGTPCMLAYTVRMLLLVCIHGHFLQFTSAACTAWTSVHCATYAANQQLHCMT